MHIIPRWLFPPTSKKNPARPRLERRNAAKHFDYDATEFHNSSRRVRSINLSELRSFRVEGTGDGELERICRSLGLSGPEDFEIPGLGWDGVAEKRGEGAGAGGSARELCIGFVGRGVDLGRSEFGEVEVSSVAGNCSETDVSLCGVECGNWIGSECEGELLSCESGQLSKAGSGRSESDELRVNSIGCGDLLRFCQFCGSSPREVVSCVRIGSERELPCELGGQLNGVCGLGNRLFPRGVHLGQSESDQLRVNMVASRGGGVKRDRPPVLKPPPGRMIRAMDDEISTWEILRSFAPVCGSGCSPGDCGNCNQLSVGQDGEKDNGCGELCEGVDMDPVHGGSFDGEELENKLRIGMVSRPHSSRMSKDDDSSLSATTESRSNSISPSEKYERIITNWQRGDILGSGSFGSVYEGYSEDGSFFAVKEVSLINQGIRGRQIILQLEQEIALLSRLKHPNIVQYYGTGKDETKLYIFLELANKGSLASLYQKYTLGDSQVSIYTRQILLGLEYLHGQKVVHRDIKCANLLLDSTGSVKLADFGLAKAAVDGIKSMKGTPFWMAPEVVRGKRHGYGIPADIWSLGCTVLEMLTGQFPYNSLEPQQALYRIGKGEPPLVPESLSTDAMEFILQCLRIKPKERPTAAELLNHPFIRRPFPSSPCIGQ